MEGGPPYVEVFFLFGLFLLVISTIRLKTSALSASLT